MKLMESGTFAVLDSHQRMLDRQAVREEKIAGQIARTAARLERRKKQTAEDRVYAASQKLEKANSPAAIALIESKSSWERDFYLLAEEFLGPNRREVLRQFPKPRKSAREAFLGSITPNESPESPPEVTAGQPEAAQDGVPETPAAVQPVGKSGKPLQGAALANWRKKHEPQAEE